MIKSEFPKTLSLACKYCRENYSYMQNSLFALTCYLQNSLLALPPMKSFLLIHVTNTLVQLFTRNGFSVVCIPTTKQVFLSH